MNRTAFKTLAFIFLLLFLQGCFPVHVTRLTEEEFGPTKEIDVLSSKPVDRPFIEIAELTVQKVADTIPRLQRKAKEIGADAIVIIGETTTPVDMIPGYYSIALPWAEPVTTVHALAIRYGEPAKK